MGQTGSGQSCYLTEFRPFIEDLCRLSARVTLPLFDNPAVVAELKEDQTPVTRADRDCESMLRDRIRLSYPEHGIIGEEFGSEHAGAEWTWVLDPIDGTTSFVHGVPLFTTLIGLMYQGRPVLGAIYQPVLEKLCIGSSEGTYLNGTRCRIRECGSLAEATVLSSGLAGPQGAVPPEVQGILGKARVFRTWGDGWGYMMVARGLADVMIDGSMKIWDLAAVLPVIEGAGGTAASLRKGDPVKDLSLVATNPILMPIVFEEMGRHPNRV